MIVGRKPNVGIDFPNSGKNQKSKVSPNFFLL